MEKFILDTGIVLGYATAAGYAEYVEKKFELFKPPRIPMMSVVSKGEIYSLAIQRRWGERKLKILEELLRKLPVVDINDEQIIQRYSEIDAYSLGKTPLQPLPKGQTAKAQTPNTIFRLLRYDERAPHTYAQDNQRTTQTQSPA